MLLFIPRSLCALKRAAAKHQHASFGATQGIRITLAPGLYRAEATDGRRAIIVQGLTPSEEPPWPGFKELPDDACEAIILPKDLERACKVGEDFLQSRFGLFGIATMGNEVCLGLGTELVTARTVEGRFPNISQVVPKKRPLFTFRVDPRFLAETLLAMADLLPDEARGVQCFYYGDGHPIGFCARNPDNGIMIDALVVPVSEPAKAAETKAPHAKPDGRRPVDPEASGQPPSKAPPEEAKKPTAPETPAPQEANGQEAKAEKKSKKTKAA